MLKFLATSDIHGYLPNITEEFDLLMICGDICPATDHSVYYQEKWIKTIFTQWINSLPYKTAWSKVILVPGNHDFWLERMSVAQKLEIEMLCSHRMKILRHDEYEFEYPVSDGLDSLIIFGTPYCSIFGHWAFMVNDETLEKKFSQIENDVDISWLSNSSIITNSEAGTFVYTATATSKENAWCFGSISSNHTVTVCPWEIAIKDGKGEADLTESKDNLDGDTPYTLSVTNEAEENPSVTWTSNNNAFTISTDLNQLSTPEAGENAQTATITATVGETEVASIEVTVAAKSGSEVNPITTWTGLVTEMQNEGGAIYISGEMTADETLFIEKSREIITVDDVTINRDPNYKGAIFTLNAPLTMTGSESAHITIDGNDIDVEQSMIYSTNQNITTYYYITICQYIKDVK